MIEDLAGAIGINDMLSPLNGESPVGIDLRNDFSPNSLYYRLRDARAEARDIERAADSVRSADAVLPAEWRTVRQLATTALLEASKDLEIAGWLTEALVRGEGIAGLAVGCTLMEGLVRRFWADGLYPQADEDGISTRVKPVTGLNGEGADGTLIQPLRKQAFFHRPSGESVAFWQYEASWKLQGEDDAKKREQRIAAGVMPLEDMERDAKVAGGTALAALRRTIRSASAAWDGLGASLEDVAGRDGPPTGRVRDLLATMLDAVERYAPREEETIPEYQEPPSMMDGVTQPEAMTMLAPVRKAETREDMLHDLARIADFFRRTEPHSPLAYTLDDAIRRGRMSWPDLLAEIVPDNAARSQMLMLLGIKPSQT